MKIRDQWKCGECGCVHVRAELEPGDHRAACRGHFRCLRCGAGSAGFVPVEPGDAPQAGPLPLIIVDDGHNVEDTLNFVGSYINGPPRYSRKRTQK